MHEAAVGSRKSNPGVVRPRDLTYCSHKPECIVTTNHDIPVLILIITWHFHFHLVNVSTHQLRYVYRAQSEMRFTSYSDYHHVVSLTEGNCPLTILVIKGRCARDALPHFCNIGEFKSVEKNSTTMKYIYNESVNILKAVMMLFYTNDWLA